MNASRKQLHDLVDLVDDSDIDVLSQVLVKFVPVDDPLPDEIEAIMRGRDGDTVKFENMNWD